MIYGLYLISKRRLYEILVIFSAYYWGTYSTVARELQPTKYSKQDPTSNHGQTAPSTPIIIFPFYFDVNDHTI